MKRVNYHLTDSQLERLQALSGKRGMAVAELIRRAVDAFLDEPKVLAGPFVTPGEAEKTCGEMPSARDVALLAEAAADPRIDEERFKRGKR